MTPPSPSHQLLDMAEAALVEGHPETTLEICRQLLSLDPHHAGAIFLEAEAFRDLREGEEAEQRYRVVLSREPEHTEAWSGMGSVLFDQGRFEESQRCFTRALRADSDNADAYYGRAMVRERHGDEAGARRDYLRAWRLSGRFPTPEPLSHGQMRQMLHQAADAAGAHVGAWVRQAPVLVLDLPDIETCDAYEPPASPGELLGHVTVQVTADGVLTSSNALPPAILLFQRNLERYAHDRDQLIAALRDSVVAQVSQWLTDDAWTVD